VPAQVAHAALEAEGARDDGGLGAAAAAAHGLRGWRGDGAGGRR
jgi:hypothetical protein